MFIDGDRVDENRILSMMAEYGRNDGRINYLYASTFAEIYRELTDVQLKALALIRLSPGFEPKEGSLFAEPLAYPSDIEYGFLFQ
jgi:hypothetical protein